VVWLRQEEPLGFIRRMLRLSNREDWGVLVLTLGEYGEGGRGGVMESKRRSLA
jgi:hypothetical protein